MPTFFHRLCIGLGCCLLLFSPLQASNSYEIEEIELPKQINPEISGVTFTPQGKLVIVNRRGEVWIRTSQSPIQWKRFAFGLHEPLGILALKEDEIYVTQRPELTRLKDSNQDGEADHYETVNDDWGVTDNWHEFTFGLRLLPSGDFFLSTGLPDVAGDINSRYPRVPLFTGKVHQEAKPSPAPHEGWAMTVSQNGKMTPVASGFRAAAGVGVSPEGEMFITDQQGDYIATSTLVHVKPDHFYGHPASLRWHKEYRGPLTLEELTQKRSPEAVALPHGTMGGSPGEPVWDTTHGKFGPFQGQIFIGDFTKLISRVYLEKVAGEYQGACFPFLRDAVGLEAIQANSGANNLTIPAGKDGLKYFQDVPPRSGTPLRAGNMRMAFAPDGSLYVAQTTRGWGQGDGLQRIVWSKQIPTEIQSMKLTKNGFHLDFTKEMNLKDLENPKNYRLNRFRYLYTPAGSPRVDEATISLSSIHPSSDRRSVEIRFSDLDPGYIYQLDVENLFAVDGKPLENPQAFYTLTRLLDGKTFQGPMNQPLLTPVVQKNAAPDPEVGRRIYGTFCVTCHQSNGKGGALPGTTGATPLNVAADFTRQDEAAPLHKSDAELIQIITQGAQGKPMPPFGGVLKPAEIRDVLAYLRNAFGDQPSK